MRILLGILAIITPLLSFAKDVSIEEKIDRQFAYYTNWFVEGIFYSIPFTDKISVPWVLIVLVFSAVFFTLYFRLINFTGFKLAFHIVRGKYDKIETEGDDHIEASEGVHMVDGDVVDTIRVEQKKGEHHGEVSHFQALTAALSATVGLGNIAGVAVAISIGGPGATFWMIVAGIIGMATKFTECTLGVKYREIDENGIVYGGPMYYLSKGLKERGMAGFGKFLAIVFAIMCIGGSFGGGNMFQSNQAFAMLQSYTGGSDGPLAGYGLVFGIVMAVLVGVVIIGGIKKIANVTDKIVPFMVGIYVLAVLVILGINYNEIPRAFSEIFGGAFTGAGIVGGVFGVLIQGFRRAAFSNEAGIGSASIAHSAVRTKYAASEGLVALLEPFIDTVIVCTMTALVLVISNGDGSIMAYGQPITEGVEVTSKAFAASISWFPIILTIAVILFAFSTMISWSYYGYQAWTFLFGRSKSMEYIYKGLFCVFVAIGAAIQLGSVINFSDAMIFAMLVPNMIGLFILAPKVKEELARFKAAIRKF
ncbi:MAG: D-alanine glycine permease [Bacteroidetes bacterium RIFCSPHIGHO2_02_FULL_44_7]|nr:MAG: D-alanine glycine permease [Bacteroidetes bacterium RIFCSPHIGHO2_02_FULL_44_7]